MHEGGRKLRRLGFAAILLLATTAIARGQTGICNRLAVEAIGVNR